MSNKNVLGLDIGDRCIGVARADLDMRIASPLTTIANDDQVFARISELIKENQAEIIVIGLPRNSSGEETDQSQVSRKFAEKLTESIDVKIIFQDESLTSVAAEDNLRMQKNFDEKMLRDGTLDSEAASLILQDFLEGGQNGTIQS